MKSATQISQVPTPAKPPATGIDPSLVMTGGLGLVILGVSIYQSRNGKTGKTATARWANAGEISNCNKLAKAAIAKPKFNKAAYFITEPIGGAPAALDKLNARVMFPQINRGVLFVGGAGAGKTANFGDPAVMSAIVQGYAIVLYDFKFGEGGQAETVIPLAIKHGYQVRILAPGKRCSQVFNILDLIGKGLEKFGHLEDAIERIKAILLEDSKDAAGCREIVAIISDNTGESDAKKDNFFDPASVSVLSGAFAAAKWVASELADPSLANILMVNQILSLPNLTKRLIANKAKIPAWIFGGFTVLTSGYDPEKKSSAESGILMTCLKTLAPVTLPNYLPAFCGTSTFPNFDPQDPLKVDGKHMIVFGVDKDNRNSTIPLVATCMDKIISRNLKPGRTTPLVISLDEFATLKLKIVLDWLNQERFNGASLIIGIQYIGQIEARYGREWSKGFLASCATKIWFNPGEDDTAQYLSKSLGEQELDLENKSQSINSGKQGGSSRSTSRQLHRIPLIEAHVIRQFPQGHCIIESPGVGNKQKIGVPYEHQFSFNEEKSNAFKAKNKAQFAEIISTIEAAQADANDIDYSEEMARYNELLEQLLPVEATTGGSTSTNRKDQLTGKQIIAKFNKGGQDISDLKIESERVYTIPPKFMKNGSPNFNKKDLAEIVNPHAPTF
ncbi:type IV secretory system conjugative DNA transfer family protein [Chamaesiphon sp.]|uniref:type IV secretory system conjugative DNA transfer family protein n=1 Tax=Chamaesiphon sp. TaxID=2814140 RepID=UPI0035931D7B